MSDNLPAILAILRAIEEHLTALDMSMASLLLLLTDPKGRTQMSQDDTFRSQFLITQMAAVEIQQREQILSLTEVIAMLHGRTIEHTRLTTAQHDQILGLLHDVGNDLGNAAIVARATQARAILHAAEQERLAEIALSEESAKALLDKARFDAKSLISRALNRAEGQIATDADTARDVIQDAAAAARDKLEQDSE